MTEVRLIDNNDSDVAIGPSSYVVPKVPMPAPKNLPSLDALPSNSSERERVLDSWTTQLRLWQESLENQSGGLSGAASSSADRPANWPFRRCAFVRFDAQEITAASGLRATWKLVYFGWFFTVCVLIFNAVAITVLRVATAALVPMAELAWAYVLWLLFGSLASFSICRLVYTAVRKMRIILIREAIFMQLLQLGVVFVCLAGIPSSGSAGIWVTIEAARSVSSIGVAPAALCAVAAAMWLTVAILTGSLLQNLLHLFV